VFIVEGNTAYAFDFIITSEYAHKLKIAEQASDVKGKAHTNYAITQPSQVSMEAGVADTVVASEEPLTKGGDVRSVVAFQRLVEIQKRRALLTVITPKYVYTNMLIESVTSTDSEEYQNEMRCQVVFKEMTVVPKVKKNKGGDPPPGGGDDPKGGDPSILKNWLNGASTWVSNTVGSLLGLPKPTPTPGITGTITKK
jgi:hypothetical protein